MKLYVFRGGLAAASMLMWFYAISVTPLAEAVALSFTAPLFATVAAIMFLGEVAGPLAGRQPTGQLADAAPGAGQGLS